MVGCFVLLSVVELAMFRRTFIKKIVFSFFKLIFCKIFQETKLWIKSIIVIILIAFFGSLYFQLRLWELAYFLSAQTINKTARIRAKPWMFRLPFENSWAVITKKIKYNKIKWIFFSKIWNFLWKLSLHTPYKVQKDRFRSYYNTSYGI